MSAAANRFIRWGAFGARRLDFLGPEGIVITDTMIPRATIEAFDKHLDALGLRFEAVVVGGSALVLLGIIQRATRDVFSASSSGARSFSKPSVGPSC